MKAGSPEKRLSTSALPRINKFSSLPREAKLSQKQTQNGFVQRTHSIPQGYFNQIELQSALGSAQPPTRNVYSYPVDLSSLGEPIGSHQQVTTAWGKMNQTGRTKKSVYSGLTMRPISAVDGIYDTENFSREGAKHKISSGDHHLPRLSPTEKGSPQKWFAKP